MIHGLWKHPLYNTWNNMKRRCYDPNYQNYQYYGGRGITICSEWLHDLTAFVTWAESHGYKKELELDRKNNDGPYCPENCRFVTREDNISNSRLIHATNTTGYRGVSWCRGRYRAQVRYYKGKHDLGIFGTPEEAARARDSFIVSNGIPAPLNFPREDYIDEEIICEEAKGERLTKVEQILRKLEGKGENE